MCFPFVIRGRAVDARRGLLVLGVAHPDAGHMRQRGRLDGDADSAAQKQARRPALPARVVHLLQDQRRIDCVVHDSNRPSTE